MIMQIHHKNGGVIIFILTNNIQFFSIVNCHCCILFYAILHESISFAICSDFQCFSFTLSTISDSSNIWFQTWFWICLKWRLIQWYLQYCVLMCVEQISVTGTEHIRDASLLSKESVSHLKQLLAWSHVASKTLRMRHTGQWNNRSYFILIKYRRNRMIQAVARGEVGEWVHP